MTDIEEKSFCPLGSKCVEAKDGIIYRCAWHIKIRGTDPNTGSDLDHWACSMSWLPTLLIENSKYQRSTGAAVESFRNEMVKANESTTQALLMATGAGNAPRLVKDIND